MRNTSLEIFMNPQDHHKWEAQKKYVSVMDGIQEQTREELLNAFSILETELGKGFLKSYTNNHPLRQKITNKAKWQIREVIQFAEVLQRLKTTQSNYEIVVPKLLSERNSRIEGVPFVEIAHSYLKENFKLWFLDEIPNERTPDIKITNPENGEIFYVEVTTLDDRKERTEQRKDYDFFHNEFHNIPPQSWFFGRQYLSLVNEELQDIKQIIADAKNKVRQNQQIVYYSDKRFNFIIAPDNYSLELQKICKSHCIRVNDVEGVPLRFNYVDQIRRKIGEKLTQIPRGSNGLIYICINTLFFMVTDLENAIRRIEESISKTQELIGVVVYSKIVDERKNQIIKFDKHRFIRRTVENCCYESLYIHNNNCEVVVSNRTFDKILQTFTSSYLFD